MKIGIDASRALRKIKTGTEYYSEQIIINLAKIDRKNDYILYSQVKPTGPLSKLPANFQWRIMPFPRGWTLFRLSVEMKKNPPDVLFIPAHTLPLIAPKKSVVMIHDLNFYKNPELYPMRQKLYHNFVIKRDVKKAAHFLVPSKYSKNDLIKLMGVSHQKINVIYHGYDESLFRPIDAQSHRSSKLKFYLFYLGRLEAKKNLIRLIRAMALLKNHHLKTVKLVLAGKPSHGYDEIKKEIEKYQLNNQVVELGYLDEKEVPFWYANARALVFPSFLEGFGMPIIEAQATACPVICSNTKPLPEIGGDGAQYFDPLSEIDMAKKIAAVLKDKSLRQRLIKKGLQNARRFSWRDSARKTLAILESV